MCIEQNLEYNCPLWLLSMDMRKAFDTIEHDARINVLNSIGIDRKCLVLIQSLHQNQIGIVNENRTFRIGRGVNQGDVLNGRID